MNSNSLLKTSWNVLKKDKEIFAFQVLSALCSVAILAYYILPLFNMSDNLVRSFLEGTLLDIPDSGETLNEKSVYYGKLFLLFSCIYFIGMFFNVATVHCAIKRMNNQEATFIGGISTAFKRLPSIFCWSLISCTVGFIFQAIENQSNWVGELVVKLIGVAWSLASFFVLPVMVFEKTNPLSALKQSAILVKDSWVTALLEEFSYGMLLSVLSSKAIFFPLFALLFGTHKSLIVAAFISLLYLMLLWSFFSALLTIFQAALFLSMKNGEIPEVFHSDVLTEYKRKATT